MSLVRYIFNKTDIFRGVYLSKIKCEKRTFMMSPLSFKEQLSMQEVKNELNNLLQVDKYSKNPKAKEHLFQYMVQSQDELPVRKMKDSYCSAIVPMSKDEGLKEKYITNAGNVRLGRLLEDVDLFAGYVGYKHIKNPKYTLSTGTPYTIVTAYIDKIDIINQPKRDLDVRVSGKVSWVGKSSMEVIVWLHQNINNKWVKIIKAFMLMAARNPTNTGPALVNQVEAETPQEQEFLMKGNERKNKRLQMKEESLLITQPTQSEFKIIHNLFMETMETKKIFSEKKILPPKSQWMNETVLNTLVFCHPEHRNAHNKVFGGFIIRKALELSWTTAYLYTLKIPTLTKISNISFLEPVEVGSVLRMIGSVVFTEKDQILIFVHAEAYNIADLSGKSTNGFHFTFKIEKPVRKVYPSTYLEAMKYIDGRRHFLNFMEDENETKADN